MKTEYQPFVEMREKAYRMGVLAANRAKEMNFPINYVMGLNPYKGYGTLEAHWAKGLLDSQK